MHPKGRLDGLIVEALGEETLVYDLERKRAHCLNRASTLVWRAANGRRSIRDIARLVARQVGGTVDEEEVARALDQLARAGLVERRDPVRRDPARRARRRLIRNLLFAPAIAT